MTPEVVIPDNYNDVTFTLEVEAMKVVDTPNPDTVSEVRYVLLGTDGEFVASHSRTLTLNTEVTGSFIDYSRLTQDNVKSWIETLSNYQLDKYSVCNVILDQKAKQGSTKALPW